MADLDLMRLVVGRGVVCGANFEEFSIRDVEAKTKSKIYINKENKRNSKSCNTI